MARGKNTDNERPGNGPADSLAIHGGSAAVLGGPPPWPAADDAILQVLQAAWSDGSWGRYLGRHGDLLCNRLAEWHELDHVLLCCSGTYAIEAALRGLPVGPGEEVILGAYDFPGNFRAIEAVGARPVLVDIDEANGTLDPAQLELAWSPSTRAVIASHLHGGLAPMQTIMAWARDRDVWVVEDACQAPGAKVAGRMAGTWGDVGVLSFGGSKLLSAGRGGAMITRHANLFQRAKVYGHRGNDAFPLSELQAAILLPQWDVLAERNRKRQASAAWLLQATDSLPGLRAIGNLREGDAPSYTKVAWHVVPPSNRAPVDRQQWLSALQAEGIAIDIGFRGFAGRSRRRCRHVGDLQNSRIAAESTVVLHHPVLLEDETVLAQVVIAFSKVATAFAV